ncbi:MAG: hypothetical protein IJW28_04125 [Clostridia bacterium]|nr:hypothetical protein [Clostridia bacterium]
METNSYYRDGNNNVFEGDVSIGDSTSIKHNNTIIESSIGKNCVVTDSYIENSTIENNVNIGPFAHIKNGSIIKDGAVIGNYVEIKNSIVGKNTKIKHLTYVGDATIGDNCNIGCGVIFANYNGRKKQKITIGNNCFIGSNVNLIAPLNIADDCYICAGATVTSDLKKGDFVIGRVRELIKPDRAYDYLKK